MSKKDKDSDKEKVKKKKKKKKSSKSSTKKNVSLSSTVSVDPLAFVRPSAFRAIHTTTDQPVASNIPVKITFSSVQFDLAGEFDPKTSTFIPSANGIYYILSTVAFKPYDPNGDYKIHIEIRVNGKQAVVTDSHFFGGGAPYLNDATVSTVLGLEAGDQVEVFAESNIPGSFVPSEDHSRFEAARFPSPAA